VKRGGEAGCLKAEPMTLSTVSFPRKRE